jgi:hypothetical protein
MGKFASLAWVTTAGRPLTVRKKAKHRKVGNLHPTNLLIFFISDSFVSHSRATAIVIWNIDTIHPFKCRWFVKY